jgi:hypothetical protein
MLLTVTDRDFRLAQNGLDRGIWMIDRETGAYSDDKEERDPCAESGVQIEQCQKIGAGDTDNCPSDQIRCLLEEHQCRVVLKEAVGLT